MDTSVSMLGVGDGNSIDHQNEKLEANRKYCKVDVTVPQ